MGAREVNQIMRYLSGLAPSFFADRMVGATVADIQRLEALSGARLTDGHREFLSWAGNTSPGRLNPFLHDRDYRVETLIAEYLRIEDDPLPSGVTYFSVTESSGEVLCLREGETLSDDPEIGCLDWPDPDDLRGCAATIVPNAMLRLESYLASSAFGFRKAQLDFDLVFSGAWDEVLERWVGDREQVWTVFQSMGFEPVFSLADGSVCAEKPGLAVRIYGDGSGDVAGDDRNELLVIRESLISHAPSLVKFGFAHEGSRVRAPRDD